MRIAGSRGARGDLPGLQVERTVLAWDRTALALLVNGALLSARAAGVTLAALGPATLALVMMLAVAVFGRCRGRRLRGSDGRGPAAWGPLTVLGAGVVALGLAELVVLVLAATRS